MGELLSKVSLRWSASWRDARCASARKVSARVKFSWALRIVVGSGTKGSVLSVRKGRAKRSSRGVALRVGRMRSLSWRIASSKCSGQLAGIDCGSVVGSSSVLSWSGAHSLLSRPRSSLLAFSMRPLTHGAYAGVVMCQTPCSSQNASTSELSKWDPPLNMTVSGIAWPWKMRWSEETVDLPVPALVSFVGHRKPE